VRILCFILRSGWVEIQLADVRFGSNWEVGPRNARHAERSNGRCSVLRHWPGPSLGGFRAGSPTWW